MKLRNKKTGEVKDFALVVANISVDDTTLAELNEEWEDYEEPKDINYWYIDSLGKIEFHSTILDEIAGTPNNAMIRKIIGNYFETKEEAEKAVEKLKAFKRLKDKGFRFTAWYGGSKNISYEITSLENETYIPRQICDDLDLLFGGEE